MFGLIKKIFKKNGEPPAAVAVAGPAPAYARTAMPSQPPRTGNPFSTVPGSRGGSATPTAPALNPTAAVRTPSAPPSGSLPDVVSLPLATVVAGLSPEFQTLFSPNPAPGLEVAFGLQAILPQLSSGRVRVAFGELRKSCPNGSCKAGQEHDTKLIELPLANILSRINPALLPRKTQRQLMDVPKDVTGLFGTLGEPLPTSVPAPAAPTASIAAPIDEPLSAPDPVIPPPPIQAPRPAAQRRQALPEDLANIPSPFAIPQSGPAVEAELPQPLSPGAGVTADHDPEPVAMPKIKFDLAAAIGKQVAQAPTPSIKPPAATPAAPLRQQPATSPAISLASARAREVIDDNYLMVSISDVQADWPEAVLDEVRQYNLSGAQLALPVGEVDLAMRKGRIAFKWKALRSWIQPTGGAPKATENDEQEVSLPLKVVAPLFLALRQPKGRQRKTHVEESIPDLFSGGPAPEPAASAAPMEIAPEPEAAPAEPTLAPKVAVVPPAPAAAVKPKAKAGQKISAANPNELVARTAELSGVTGSLLAMSDGLVVASQLPKPLQGETVAAFLPQIFGRLTQFSAELKLGDLTSVMLVMDNCPWIIFRTGKVFFAVVGSAGEALPLPQLTSIVADIKRQNM